MIKLKNIILLISFLILIYTCSNRSQKIIGLQPYSGFNKDYLDTVKLAVKKVYHVNLVILSYKNLPDHSFVNIKSPRYRADTIIKLLKITIPDSIDYVLGLTNNDISTSKRDANGHIKQPESKYKDWGVFGLGYISGPSSMVSTYRLSDPDQGIFFNRLKKVCIHELGHNMGLKHCTTKGCVMQDAVEKISTIDNVKMELCSKCKKLNKLTN